VPTGAVQYGNIGKYVWACYNGRYTAESGSTKRVKIGSYPSINHYSIFAPFQYFIMEGKLGFHRSSSIFKQL
jgi:hypothetical protein